MTSWSYVLDKSLVTVRIKVKPISMSQKNVLCFSGICISLIPQFSMNLNLHNFNFYTCKSLYEVIAQIRDRELYRKFKVWVRKFWKSESSETLLPPFRERSGPQKIYIIQNRVHLSEASANENCPNSQHAYRNEWSTTVLAAVISQCCKKASQR